MTQEQKQCAQSPNRSKMMASIATFLFDALQSFDPLHRSISKLIPLLLLSLILSPALLAQTSNSMGIGLGYYSYGNNRDRLFADVMKGCDVYSAATKDANGWPTQDFTVYAWKGAINMNGTYKLSFTGTATVALAGISYSIQNKTYNATTNTTTADVIINTSGTANCQLIFMNTNYNGTLNSGVKNIKLMRPLVAGGTTCYPETTTFTNEIKALVGKFSVIRFMDYFSTNSNNLTTWSQRSLPTDATQTQRRLLDPLTTGTFLQDVGGCYEYAIQLCNETNKDFWLNIPLQVDDDYVTQLATLVKNNLNSNLKVYVEYSNEVWNGAPGFSQANDNHTLAVNEVQAGGSPLNYDGETNDWYWAWRRPGKRTVEISNIFRSVFGDAAMMTRIRPVLMGQLGVPGRSPGMALRLIEDVYGKPSAWTTTPHPVNYYIYGACGSAYYGPSWGQTPPLDLNNFWTSASMDVNKWSSEKAETDWAVAYGLKRVAYEGGPSLDVTGTLTTAAWNDPRMTTAIIDHHNYWTQVGGDLLVYYSTTGGYSWGFTVDMFTLNTPKLLGVDSLNANPRVAITYGATLPATLSGTQANLVIGQAVKNYLVAGDLLLYPKTWGSYTFRADTAGSFNVSFKTIAKYSFTGSVRFTVDGSVISGTGTVNSPSQTSGTFSTGFLQPGLHALRLTNSGTANVGVSTVTITPAGSSEILRYKFDEGSGTTVTDSSGGHTTTVSGAKWTTLGKLGGAYNNATDTSSLPVRFSPANQADLNFNPSTDDFTISCWVKISPTVAVTYRPFVGKFVGSPTANFQYMLWLPNNFSRLGAYVGNQGASFALPAAINDDQWHLLTLTNGSVSGTKKFTMYFDDGTGSKASLPITSGTWGITSGSCQIYPGVGSGGVGQMDDFRILNRAITPAEVSNLYNGTFTP